MTSRTFTATVVKDGAMCYIPLPFDPKAVFGKVRAPVAVTLGAHGATGPYTFRSTVAAMGGPPCVPLREAIEKRPGSRAESG